MWCLLGKASTLAYTTGHHIPAKLDPWACLPPRIREMRVCRPSGGRDLRVPGGTTSRGKEGSAAVPSCSPANQGMELAAGKPFFQRPASPRWICRWVQSTSWDLHMWSLVRHGLPRKPLVNVMFLSSPTCLTATTFFNLKTQAGSTWALEHLPTEQHASSGKPGTVNPYPDTCQKWTILKDCVQKSCEKEDCDFVFIWEIEHLSKNTQIGSGLHLCLQ